MAIRVQATKRGIYKGMREPGEVFEVNDESELGSWMEVVKGEPRPMNPAVAFAPPITPISNPGGALLSRQVPEFDPDAVDSPKPKDGKTETMKRAEVPPVKVDPKAPEVPVTKQNTPDARDTRSTQLPDIKKPEAKPDAKPEAKPEPKK
jgi:hypothetical protein